MNYAQALAYINQKYGTQPWNSVSGLDLLRELRAAGVPNDISSEINLAYYTAKRTNKTIDSVLQSKGLTTPPVAATPAPSTTPTPPSTASVAPSALAAGESGAIGAASIASQMASLPTLNNPLASSGSAPAPTTQTEQQKAIKYLISIFGPDLSRVPAGDMLTVLSKNDDPNNRYSANVRMEIFKAQQTALRTNQSLQNVLTANAAAAATTAETPPKTVSTPAPGEAPPNGAPTTITTPEGITLTWGYDTYMGQYQYSGVTPTGQRTRITGQDLKDLLNTGWSLSGNSLVKTTTTGTTETAGTGQAAQTGTGSATGGAAAGGAAAGGAEAGGTTTDTTTPTPAASNVGPAGDSIAQMEYLNRLGAADALEKRARESYNLALRLAATQKETDVRLSEADAYNAAMRAVAGLSARGISGMGGLKVASQRAAQSEPLQKRMAALAAYAGKTDAASLLLAEENAKAKQAREDAQTAMLRANKIASDLAAGATGTATPTATTKTQAGMIPTLTSPLAQSQTTQQNLNTLPPTLQIPKILQG
jgi:hypothetical protein